MGETSGEPFFVTERLTIDSCLLPDGVEDWLQEIHHANDAFVRLDLSDLDLENEMHDENVATPETTAWVKAFRKAFPDNDGHILVEFSY